ncbi:hypothetical protein GCM10027347_17450 [Larkinella harenae]
MNRYLVEIATHAGFCLVWEFELQATSMDEAEAKAAEWMNDNGFSLCTFTYIINQTSGIREALLMPNG